MSDSTAQRRAVVITASNRAAAGVYEDICGPLIAERLRAWGFAVDAPVVVPDGEPVGEALSNALGDGVDLVLTTGGTGITPTDRTPEVTAPQVQRLIPGIAEAIRAAGVAKGIPTAVLSRGVAGATDRSLVINLPGSRGGVKDALEVLEPIIDHALSQLAGGDH